MDEKTPAQRLEDMEFRLIRIENAAELETKERREAEARMHIRFDGLETQLNNIAQAFSTFYEQVIGFVNVAQQKMNPTTPASKAIMALMAKRAARG